MAPVSKSLERINVGIVGLGRIADLHAPGYAGSRPARIYAVCDTDPELARARQKSWKAVKSYTDFSEMLADPAIDAIEILTPQKLHEPMACAAVRAGIHVALQKPMTTDLAGADRILRARGEHEKVFRITDNYLFYPPIAAARALIDDGAIGTPVTMHIKLVAGGSGGWEVPASSWEWRMRERAEGRGMQTFDHGHHLYATALHLMGAVERTASWIDSLDGVIDSPAVIMFKCAGRAAYGMIEYAISPDLHIPSRYYANDEWIEITGTQGIIFISRCTGNIHPGPPLLLFNGSKWKPFQVTSDWRDGFIGATRNFINAIRGDEKPLLSGEEGRAVLSFALAVQKSARVRREVFPAELDSPWPWLHARRRLRHDRRMAAPGPGSRPGGRTTRYAMEAKRLTGELPRRFDSTAVPEWRCTAGLHILAEGGSPELRFTVIVADGAAIVRESDSPPDADIVLHVPAGTWAAILMGKKKIEMAFVQGKIKIDGRAEEGLKLRAAFRL